MNYFIAVTLVSLPLVAFLIAGMLELRFGKTTTQKVLSLFPVLLAIFLWVLSWGPVALARFPEIVAGNWLTFLWAMVACSGVLIPYARRLSSVLVALGGLELVFMGVFFAKAIV